MSGIALDTPVPGDLRAALARLQENTRAITPLRPSRLTLRIIADGIATRLDGGLCHNVAKQAHQLMRDRAKPENVTHAEAIAALMPPLARYLDAAETHLRATKKSDPRWDDAEMKFTSDTAVLAAQYAFTYAENPAVKSDARKILASWFPELSARAEAFNLTASADNENAAAEPVSGLLGRPRQSLLPK